MSTPYFAHHSLLHHVFGRAVSIEPAALFNTVKDMPPTEIQPTRITQAVDYLKANHFRPDDPILELHSSFYDVRMIMNAALDGATPPLDMHEALGVAVHTRTTQLMARIALVPSVYYTEHILENPSIVSIPEREYLEIAPDILPDERMGKGCPFAGDNPERRLYPIFLKYTAWAAQFCVYDYYYEKNDRNS